MASACKNSLIWLLLNLAIFISAQSYIFLFSCYNIRQNPNWFTLSTRVKTQYLHNFIQAFGIKNCDEGSLFCRFQKVNFLYKR